MIRARTTVAATVLAGILVGLLGLVAPAEAARSAVAKANPLRVTMTSISPAAIPGSGPIVITGTVTNTTHDVWHGVHVYPLTSTTPLTTTAELQAAAASDPESVIGDRLLNLGRSVGTLAVGQTKRFTLRLPRKQLQISGAPGVYWLGVHALGANDTGSDQVADGRARTFIPLIGPRASSAARVSLVLPVTSPIAHTAAGAVAHPTALLRSAGTGGRLRALLDLAAQSGSFPVTWLVDPAVLDALASVELGNPPLALGPAGSGTPTPSPSAGPSSSPSTPASTPTPPSSSPSEVPTPSGAGSSTTASPTGSPTGNPTGSPTGGASTGAGSTAGTTTPAGSWLAAWSARARSDTVLALPYGNLDVSSLGSGHGHLLERAWKLSRAVMSANAISGSTPAVDPPDGYLAPSARTALPSGTTVLLADHGTRRAAVTAGGVRYVFPSSAAASGGPAPGDRTTTLALRQRILAEAALDVLRNRPQPLVVVLPDSWTPGDPATDAAFFSGLAQSWIVPSTLPSGTQADAARIDWPASARKALLPPRSVAAATDLDRLGDTTVGLFPRDASVAHTLRTAAMSAASVYARTHPRAARVSATAVGDRVHRLLGAIRVEGTDFVILSGGSGVLTVAIHNGLNEAVRVGLTGRTDDPRLRITGPGSPLDLPAGRRATARVHAESNTVGVHEVTLSAVAPDGTRVGRALVFSLRTSQLGRVFWAVVGVAVVVLVLLILRRLRQRLRSRRWRA